jgi:hypothetical protein
VVRPQGLKNAWAGVFGHWPDTKRDTDSSVSPISYNNLKLLHYLARPKRFELLTPRFVVWGFDR